MSESGSFGSRFLYSAWIWEMMRSIREILEKGVTR